MKILIIVESPAKARTIQKIVGSNYIVKASFGHLRDLHSKKLSIDVEHNYKPTYVILKGKYKKVKELKELCKQCDDVILASDEDREGEAIAWHICYLLKLNVVTTKRIVFHEITKNAILKALQNPTTINMYQFNAQQARRIIDRLIGFKLSPLIWKSVKSSLSVGRVQSVVNRLIIDKEQEIKKFTREKYYVTHGLFSYDLQGELNKKFKLDTDVIIFLKNCIHAKYYIQSITDKEIQRNPPVPFKTSTLQQEGSNILHLAPKTIMSLAQQLYEKGLITYHRTDSITLSKQILEQIKEYIHTNIGNNYYKSRNFRTKQKNAQEAHEAIRPTNINKIRITKEQTKLNKLYEL